MVPAAEPARRSPPPLKRRLWRTPLVVGLCFGLGYGITNRLLALQWPGFVQLGQSFDLRPFPGSSLEGLRQRFGAEDQAIRGDLDLIELEAQNRKEQEQARRQAELDMKRLEAPEQPLEAALPLEPEPRRGQAAPTPAAAAVPSVPATPAVPVAPAVPAAPRPPAAPAVPQLPPPSPSP